MRVLLIAEKTSEGEANVVACRKNPARICFELGDYLPNKDLGNIFEKFENSEELEEYLENEDYNEAWQPYVLVVGKVLHCYWR